MGRIFEDRPATREATPVMIGLIGPSGTGKTYSALRLATGIQRVSGGDIFFIDTESRRALHYADRFKFRHLSFGAPFGPLDYLAAVEHCVAKGAKTIVVDSMSHEHEGPGGVLEMHDVEVKRLMSEGGFKSEFKASIPAWGRPKKERRRFISTLLQIPANFIFCFRAKEKLKIVKGRDPEPQGFMPLGGDEFVYELMARAMLLPGANGVPTWHSEDPGTKEIAKLPEQFRAMFAEPSQLSEGHGQVIAEWAAGVTPKKFDAVDLLARYAACSDPATLRGLETERGAAWDRLDKPAKAQLKTAKESAEKRIADANAAPPDSAAPLDDEAELRAEALERERAELAAEKKGGA